MEYMRFDPPGRRADAALARGLGPRSRTPRDRRSTPSTRRSTRPRRRYSNPPTRGDLADEAIVLGRALAGRMPDESEVHGVLALMLLLDAARDARFDDDEIVLLADRDRSRWDISQIAEGRTALECALALHGRGPYVVQAAIKVAARRGAARLDRDRRPVLRALSAHRLAGWSS